MTTDTKQPAAAAGYKLAAPRGKLKTGLPTEGMWIFVGNPKSGKTTLSASIPGAIVLELERGGADHVAGWIQDVNNMAEFRQAFKAAMSEPAAKAIVIDSIDVVSDWLEQEVAEQFGLTEVGERKEGVNGFDVWKELKRRVEGMVDAFKRSKKLVVLLAHCREPKVDGEGRVLTPAGINMPGKIGGYVAAQADAIGYTFKRQAGNGTQYVITFQGGPLGVWGSRLPEVEDKTVILPKDSQWGAIEALFSGVKPAAKTEPKAEAEPKTTRKKAGSAAAAPAGAAA